MQVALNRTPIHGIVNVISVDDIGRALRFATENHLTVPPLDAKKKCDPGGLFTNKLYEKYGR
jgi:hypothetical protein